MTEFLAKPYQTYSEHIRRAYQAWKEVIPFFSPFIQQIADMFQVSSERILQSSLLTVVFHDAGKLCLPFQNMMQEIRDGKVPDYSRNYRHEIASFPYVFYAGRELAVSKGSICPVMGIEALAVLGHHKRVTADFKSFSREVLGNMSLSWAEGGVEHVYSVANDIFAEEGYDVQFSVKDEQKRPHKSMVDYVSKMFPKLHDQVSNTESFRMLFVFLKAVLHYADWYGSSGKSILFSPKITAEVLEEEVQKRCAVTGRVFSGFSDFQRKCAGSTSHVIAVAPTGSGKTEASLLWAQNGFSDGRKLIYLLPTMVTSNSLYLRMADYFSHDDVGLVHSSSSLFKESELDVVSQNYGDVLREKAFMMPVTVSTVDQLLFSGFNKGFWTLVEANAAKSMIVIDEIHAYDGWTLGLIISAIRHFQKLGAKFMVMSATMPRYLKGLLMDALPNAEVIEDTALLSSSRNAYSFYAEGIEEAFPEIEEAVRSGKKVLLVVNNVFLCQKISESLKHLHPVCYHSKFIFGDRAEKEKFILDISRRDGRCLVVATQVVEVSLDIDFDILFTECAPPDALSQRGGRVNRSRRKTGTEVRVYHASDVSSKIYEGEFPGILTRTEAVLRSFPSELTEADLISFVEEVYSGIDISENPDFQKAGSQYAKTQRRLISILDNPYLDEESANEVTRLQKVQDMTVIPLCFKDVVLQTEVKSRKEYEVKMPLWYVKKHMEEIEGIVFCDMDYDSEYGARYRKNTEDGFQMMV